VQKNPCLLALPQRQSAFLLATPQTIWSPMFTTMLDDLQRGSQPDPGPLRQRLQAAMVKKQAMMRLHHHFHHNDSKINPRTDHMLWAATLLEDDEAQQTLVTILLAEAHDKFTASRGAMDAPSSPPHAADILAASYQNLLATSSDKELNQLLKHKIKKTSVFKELLVRLI
jgi:hypothetical protein